MPSLPVIASFILGFCGVIYELVFAQTLSVLFGQSAVQYSVTIGLFLLAMGFGSHWSERWPKPRESLWLTQLLLSLLAPIMWITVWWLATGGYNISARILAYTMCLSIGLVTGAELPLIFRCQIQFCSNSASKSGLILSFDYFGMLLACVLFPLLLLPLLGVFTTLFATALLNSLMMMSLRFQKRSAAIPLALITALIFESPLREWLSQRLIG